MSNKARKPVKTLNQRLKIWDTTTKRAKTPRGLRDT